MCGGDLLSLIVAVRRVQIIQIHHSPYTAFGGGSLKPLFRALEGLAPALSVPAAKAFHLYWVASASLGFDLW